MDKKIAGLLGAAAALTTMTSVQAASPAQQTQLAPATSYRDLLDPIPNALPKLIADDAQRSEAPATELAQYGHHHHHHHHHHARHHHHHHHHRGHHHHHHHHH